MATANLTQTSQAQTVLTIQITPPITATQDQIIIEENECSINFPYILFLIFKTQINEQC